jgi:hypothetical protein
MNEATAITIEDAGFTAKTYNCLKRAKFRTLGDIAGKTERELYKVRNLGLKSMKEILMKLNEHNLSLKVDVDVEYEEYCKMKAEGRFEVEEEVGRNIAFQVMMRDSHGTIETDHWGVVTNAGTFDVDGYPIEGGMYDPETFGLCDMGKGWKQVFGTYSPENIVGQMGIMELALPVCDPYCPKEIDPAKWVHITAIPVLPISFRTMSRDGKKVSKAAKLWNELAALNFSIPKLLEKYPEREEYFQEKLQDAVNAVYALYDQLPVPEDEFEMHCFLYHAMMPIEIEEDYDTVLSLIKTIKATAELMKNVFDAEEQLMWIRNLCRICNVVGYDSNEVAEYLAWSEEILEGIDAWMNEEDE